MKASGTRLSTLAEDCVKASAYVSKRQHTHTSAYVSIQLRLRQHTSAYVSSWDAPVDVGGGEREGVQLDTCIRQHTSAYISIRIRQHTLLTYVTDVC